jgi:hypothetical protein
MRPAGMPHECPVVSVSDGLSIAHSGMRFSLISRELIADSVEAIVRGHQFDGIVAATEEPLPGRHRGARHDRRSSPEAPYVHPDVDNVNVRPTSTSRDHALRRLRDQRPDPAYESSGGEFVATGR